jgi:hypothetical protein
MAGEQPAPSYHTLMTHIKCAIRPSYYRYRIALTSLFSYQLHANCRALHKYTLNEKRKARRGEGPGFDGDLNNFQAPQLSSLAKLVSIPLSGYCNPLTDAWIRI